MAIVILVTGTVSAGSSLAQVNAGNMRSGSLQGSGGLQNITLFTVPSGMRFVLTDLMWSPNLDAGPQQVNLLRLQMSVGSWMWYAVTTPTANGSQVSLNLPTQIHWTTGLVFEPFSAVLFNIGDLSVFVNWFVSWSGYLTPVTAGAAGDPSPPAPSSTLGQNTPNPFNPATEIRYTLPGPGPVDLRIYDSEGRLVRKLDEGAKQAGEHVVRWDGRDNAGQAVSSGVYYYALNSNTGNEARKAVLLR